MKKNDGVSYQVDNSPNRVQDVGKYEPIAFEFDDSSHKVLAAELMTRVSVKEDLEVLQARSTTNVGGGGDGNKERLIAFRKEGRGDGLKDLNKFIQDEGLIVTRDFVKHLVQSYRDSRTYSTFDMRVMAATDLLESTLLRLNFYLRERNLWLRLESEKINLPIFQAGKDHISYAGLCSAFKELLDNGLDPVAFKHYQFWISFAMAYAERQYLNERGATLVTEEALRYELWDFFMVSKRITGRNTSAHIFSTALEQIRTPKVRCLTDIPASGMTQQERDRLVVILDDLVTNPPAVYKNQENLFSMQLAFMKDSLLTRLRLVTPSAPPPVMHHEARSPMRPPGT